MMLSKRADQELTISEWMRKVVGVEAYEGTISKERVCRHDTAHPGAISLIPGLAVRYPSDGLNLEPSLEAVVGDGISLHNPQERRAGNLELVLQSSERRVVKGNTDQLKRQVRKAHLSFAGCACTWDLGADTAGDFYPTSRTQPGISKDCWVHQVIEACNDYCRMIDDEWLKTADWYRFPDQIKRDVGFEQRYIEWRRSGKGGPYDTPNPRWS